MKTIDNIRWQLDGGSGWAWRLGGILFSLAVWVAIVAVVLAVL